MLKKRQFSRWNWFHGFWQDHTDLTCDILVSWNKYFCYSSKHLCIIEQVKYKSSSLLEQKKKGKGQKYYADFDATEFQFKTQQELWRCFACKGQKKF